MPKKTRATKVTDKKKAWNKKANASAYKIDTKAVNKTILIVGEGQTEKLYFESFPVLTLTVKAYNSHGQSKLKLIEATDNIIEHSDIDFDEVWCLFDMDVKHGAKEYADFDNAIASAKAKGYHVGYSNDCFELWFFLHYQYIDQRNHRTFYYQFLSNKWNCNYEKEGKTYKFCQSLYERLLGDETASQKEAIKRAERLFNEQSTLPYHRQNPISQVYKLIKFLNKNCRR